MKPEQLNQRKLRLKDPIDTFTREFPDGDQQQIDQLKKLCQQYQSNNQQHKAIQQQTQQISRQIGAAKREGHSIAPLKQQMQQFSAQAKTLIEQIKGVEKQILSVFDPAQGQESDKHPVSTETTQRIYSGSIEDSHNINISRLSTEQLEWDSYVDKNPATSIYHQSKWKELIQTSFGHEAYYFLARNAGGQIVGVLPLIRLKSHLFGDFQVSMPYFNHGGAIADHPLIEQQLMAAANNYAEQLDVSHIEYRDDIPRPGLPARTDKVNMLLALPKNEEDLWQSFTPKLRAQIKRPQRESPNIILGNHDLLDDFYNVFARNMRDLGTPVYSKSFFINILNAFPHKTHILLIQLKGRAVAAAFLIGHRNTLEIPWASSLREVNHLSMNMLMYWEVLRFAIKQKYQYFDFGRSSKNSGTFRFKQQWGAKPKPLFWHYWLANDAGMPALNPSNPKYTLMINVWRRLPVFLTKWLGPRIVKNLP